MNKDKTIKLIGTAISLVGFGISLLQKQLDDRQLQDLIKKEVQKQLENR